MSIFSYHSWVVVMNRVFVNFKIKVSTLQFFRIKQQQKLYLFLVNSSHIFVIFYTSFSIVIPTLGAILQKKFKLRSLTNIRCVPERQGPPVWVYPGSGGWCNAFLLADGQYSPWWSSCKFQIVAWKKSLGSRNPDLLVAWKGLRF